MSDIDKRVVQMVFDNEDFEKNIAKSQKSLESMDKTINKVAENTSAKNIGNVLESSVGKAVEGATLKVEALRSVINTVMSSITSSVMGSLNKVQAMINNLTFDQMNVGFGKYEEKLTSVQTIMNATGRSIEYVEEQLEKLNWFTDETSYNFSDMANNIGKFTAVGVELEQASSAMQGIANWAGLAGQNAQAASHAMYNLAQAMSQGYVGMQDWKSIQNANMDTQEFRKLVFNTAKEMAESGKYTKETLEWFETASFNDFFSDMGKSKRFTTDVLMESLQVFSSYSDEVKRISDENDVSTHKAMELLDKITIEQADHMKESFKMLGMSTDEIKEKAKETGTSIEEVVESLGEGGKELKKQADELGISIETALNIAKIGGANFDLGRRAFHAAQEYKTFKDVIDATNDAVSTLWMNVYQQIFGNYEEAKQFWTELGGIFYDIFAGPVEKILDIFKEWNSWSGRKILIDVGEEADSVFSNLVDNLSKVTEYIKKAFFEINPFFKDTQEMGLALSYATLKLREFVKELKPTRQQLVGLKEIFVGIFRIMKGFAEIFYAVGKGIGLIVEAILPSFGSVAELFKQFNKTGKTVDEAFKSFANNIYRTAYIIAQIIKGIKKAILDGTIVNYLRDLVLYIASQVIYVINSILHPVETELTGFKKVVYDVFSYVWNAVSKFIAGVATIVVPIIQHLVNLVIQFFNSGFGAKIVNFFDAIINVVFNGLNLFLTASTMLLNGISDIFAKLNDILENGFDEKTKKDVKGFASVLSMTLGTVLMLIGYFFDAYRTGRSAEAIAKLGDMFESIGEAIGSIQNTINAVAIKAIAKSVAILAISVLVIASVPAERLKGSLAVVATSLVSMFAALVTITKIGFKEEGIKGMLKVAESVLLLSGAMAVMAIIINEIASTEDKNFLKGIAVFAAEMGLIIAFIGMLIKVTRPAWAVNKEVYEIQLKNLTKIWRILASMSLLIASMTAVFKTISALKPEELFTGIVGFITMVAGIVILLTSVSKVLGKNATMDGFAKKMAALSVALVVFTGAMQAMMAPIIILGALSQIPGNVIITGLIDTAIAMVIMLTTFGSLIKKTNKANADGLLAIAALMAILVFSVNALLSAFLAIAMLPAENYLQGIQGIKKIVTMLALSTGIFDLIFIVIPKILTKWDYKKIEDNALMKPFMSVSNWVNNLIFVGLTFIELAIAVKLVTDSAAKLAESGDSKSLFDSVNAVALFIGEMMGIILAMYAIESIVAWATGYNMAKDMVIMAGMILVLSGSVALLTYAIERFANSIDAEDIGNALGNMVKAIAPLMGAIVVVIAIVGILGKIFGRTQSNATSAAENAGLASPKGSKLRNLLRLPDHNSGVTKIVTSIAQDLRLFGAGLLSMSAALVALMVPIWLLGSNKMDEYFSKAAGRLAALAAGLGVFISVLMAVYGLMGYLSGKTANPYGINKLTKKETKGIKAIFGKSDSEVNSEKITGFGENIYQMTKGLLMIVGAVSALVVPVYALGKINKDEFEQGLKGVTDILVAIGLTLGIAGFALSDLSVGKIWGIGIILTAVFSVLALVVTNMEEFNDLSKDLKGGITILAVIGVIGVIAHLAVLFKDLVNVMKNGPDEKDEKNAEKEIDVIFKAAGAFALLAAGMAIIAGALWIVNKIGPIDLGPIISFVGVIAAAMGYLILISTQVEDGWKPIKAAGAFTIMAASIVAIAGSFKLLETVNVSKNQLMLFAGTLAVIFVILHLLSQTNNFLDGGNKMLEVAISFGIISASLIAIVGALMMLQTVALKPEQIAYIAGFVIAVGVLVGVMSLLNVESLLGAASIAIAFISVAVSLVIFAAAIDIVVKTFEGLVTCMQTLADWAETKGGWQMWDEAKEKVIGLVDTLADLIGKFAELAKENWIAIIPMVLMIGAVFLLSVAILAVVLALYVLSISWPQIEIMLDNLTEWLKLHKDDWSEIMSAFGVETHDIFADMEKDGKAAADNISQEWSDKMAGIILESEEAFNKISLLEGSSRRKENVQNAADTIDAYLKNVAGGSLLDVKKLTPFGDDWWSFKDAMPDETDFAANEQNMINAMKELFGTNGDFRYMDIDDLDNLMGKMGYTASHGYAKDSDAYVNARQHWLDAFIKAGGSFNIDGQLYSSKNIDRIIYGVDYYRLVNDRKKGKDLLGNGGNIVTGPSLGRIKSGLVGEDVSVDAGMMGDGISLLDDNNTNLDSNTAALNNNTKALGTYGGLASNTTLNLFDKGDSYKAGQTFGIGFLDTISNIFVDRNGNSILAGLFTDQNGNSIFDNVGKALEPIVKPIGDSVNGWLESNGMTKIEWEDLGDFAKDTFIDKLASFAGINTESEEFKEWKKDLTIGKGIETGKAIYNDVMTAINNGENPITAIKEAAKKHGLPFAEGGDSDIWSLVQNATGITLFGEGGTGLNLEEYMKKFKAEKIINTEDIEKQIADVTGDLDFGETGEDLASDLTAGFENYKDFSFDPSSIMSNYGYNAQDMYNNAYDIGTSQGLGQIDGYGDTVEKQMKNLKDKYNLSDITGGALGLKSEDKGIWRGYGRNGEELWAPSKEDMYNNLVKPIRDGFEWHGWDAKDATPWKAVETAADAMKGAAETEKTIITDAKKQRWELDENAGKWYAIDENGKRINKTDAEGKESPWSVPAQKQDAKIQNGVWVWDATNKQWILTVNGKYADLGNGIQLADTKSGILDTPTLTDAQYQALAAKLANDEKKKTADQRKNDLLYGDLDKKIQAFTNKEGKQLYYGDRKVEATDYETGKKRMVQKKYALRGRKLAGYDNAYALVDQNGNLIFNNKGERITFTVDKTNGVKLMSESMTQAANTMNEAGKEVQNAAKNPNTKAAMYGASTALTNAEATKDVYSTAVVHNQDTGLVESKYNNNVVAQNQSNQQAQDATQSAKSAIDHLQEINSKMTEVRDLMISNNMMLATIEALNMNMDKSMKDASARPLEFNIDGKKVAEATKGFMNKSLGVVSRMGGRQVAT